MMFRLKVQLSYIEPPIWRVVDVAADSSLPELHDVLQEVMGWTHSHLHEFAAGTKRYAMQMSLDEYDDGSEVCEDGVLIEDVLPAVGSSLVYEYDFGDGWRHTVTVESITTHEHVRRAVCVAGERACPPEDCGGVGGYADLLVALTDPEHPEHLSMREWAGHYDPEAFDVDQVNTDLATLAQDTDTMASAAAGSPYIDHMFLQLIPRGVPALMTSLARCDFASKDVVDAETAAKSFDKVLWLLNDVGDKGITLTSAGYLPPPHIKAIRDEIEWGKNWWGSSTREVDHYEVSHVRDIARMLGLVRTSKGRLLLTKVGAKLRADPVALWNHAASRLPFGKERYEVDASVLYLVAAAGAADNAVRDAMMLETMPRLGWMDHNMELRDWNALRSTTASLFRLTANFDPSVYFDDGPPSRAAQLFALDCLRHVRT